MAAPTASQRWAAVPVDQRLGGYDTASRGLAWMREQLAGERAESGIVFHPFTDTFRRDPDAVYAELRQRSPVHYSRLLDCWLVTRHREVDRVLRDHRRFRSDPRHSTQDLRDPFGLLDDARPALFMLDPPDHTRLREVIRDAFGPRATRRLAPKLAAGIRSVVAGLGQPGDTVDLVPRFATVVPWLALDLLTGLETRAIGTVSRWVATVAHAMEPLATARTAQQSLAAYRALGSYLDERRSGPFPDGTLGATLREAVRAGRLSDAEARQLLLFVVLAGTKTSTDFLAGAARHLAALPPGAPARQRLTADLVDDLLRWTSPVQLVARTATARTRLGGRTVHPGQRVLLVLASANRDPGAGLEHVGARGHRDLSFGRGVHRCVGAHLARLQGHLALSTLLETFPTVTLLRATRTRRGVTVRGWDSVVVRL